MSNAKANLLGSVTHALHRKGHGGTLWSVCGAEARYTDDRAFVTCKRCLASLAKRDREFQRKARAWFATRRAREAHLMLLLCGAGPSPVLVYPFDAARAIAREEGLAL